MTPCGGEHQRPDWRGLEAARRAAAQRGSTSIGTQHVLLALLSWPDDDVLAALRGSRVDQATAIGALERIVGRGACLPALPVDSIQVSPRVARILAAAARRGHRSADGDIPDRDVLAALLESDDPAVGQLIVELIDSPRRVLDALNRT